MRTALTGALVAAALAILAALLPLAASAQDPGTGGEATPTPTPTATPTPTPTPDPDPRTDEKKAQDAEDRRAKPVKRIYRDYTRDALVKGCDHTVKALRKTLRSIEPTYDEDFPDFRQAVEAAVKAHKKQRCEKLKAAREKRRQEAAAKRDAAATPTPSAPPSPPPPAPAPQSGALPGLGSGGGSGGGEIEPLPESTLPEATPAPPAAAPAAPAPPPLPPTLVVTRASADPDLFVPGALLAVALLGLLFAALSALGAKRSGRLAGVGHAWREAAWRSSGTWADFTDWLRAGR